MSELSHEGAYRLIYQGHLSEAERLALRSHLQTCAACRRYTAVDSILRDSLALENPQTRPTPQFTGTYMESVARHARRYQIMKPLYTAGGAVLLALLILASWFIVRSNIKPTGIIADLLDEQLIANVTAGDVIEVERLLDMGIDSNSELNAMLPIAARAGQLEVVRLLLDRGADVNSRMNPSGSDKTALLEAAINDRDEIVELLIAAGADVNQVESNSGFSALHYATLNSSESIIDTLLKNGADPNLQAKNGQAPLHFAARYRYIFVTRKLLNSGAEIDIPDNGGLTPMMEGIVNGRDTLIQDTVILFLLKGADPNRQDNNGNAALHHAAMANRPITIPRLIEHGASLDLKNNDGQTASDLAKYGLIKEALRAATE